MKHLHKTIALRLAIFCILASALGSCLDENPRDRIDEEEAFNTAEGLVLNTLFNLYNNIGGNKKGEGLQGTTHGIYDLNTFSSDEAILPTRGVDWYDGGLWRCLYLHMFSPSMQPIESSWNYLYKVIVMCNQSLDHIKKYHYLLDDNSLEAITAEVRGIRALYYYYLLDMFGRVPYVTSSSTSMREAKQVSRSSLFHNVWDEFQEILPSLADERSNTEGDYYGRMTRHVAWFVLAKMALNAQIWTDDDWTDDERPDGGRLLLECDGEKLNAWEACIYYCDQLAIAGYKLENNYENNFAVYNEESKENIFTIPMDKILYSNEFHYLFRSRHNNHGNAIGMDAENGTSATLSAVKTYGYGTDHQDLRYGMNFYSDTLYINNNMVYLDNGEPLVYYPLEISVDLTDTPFEKTAGARMKKYELDRTAYSDGKLQDNDIVLFRYADVLLMKSEAKIRNGEDGDDELNAVRSRVGMGWRKATLKNILDERLMELQWEGWRRQDLVRFGQFHLKYDMRPQVTGEGNAFTTVFPIPGRAISLNNQLTQNPGY